jgi:IrrE N-terminal-like domain
MGNSTIKLHQLTDLVPRRPLNPQEAIIIAEIQANMLLLLGEVTAIPVPVTDLIRRFGIIVEHDPKVDKFGRAAVYDDGRWHIRHQRVDDPDLPATLAHLLKIILDQPFGMGLYPPTEVATSGVRKHYVAEYFAAHLTMPQPWIEQLWRSGQHDTSLLASSFGVRTETMHFRLRTLGLLPSDAVPPNHLLRLPPT